MNPHGVGATTPLDLAAIATFNNGGERARDDYYARTDETAIKARELTRRADAQKRYRNRTKEGK